MESKLVGKNGTVYAVEPIKNTFKQLEENIELNNAHNITTFNLALGNKNGKAKMEITTKCNQNRISPTEKEKELLSGFKRPKKTGEETVRIMTCDKFLENKKAPNLIRMDVEGYEYQIIKGLKKTLKNNSPAILMEFHPQVIPKKEIEKMANILEKNNYQVAWAATEFTQGFSILGKRTINNLMKIGLNWLFWAKPIRTNINGLKKYLLSKEADSHVLFAKQTTKVKK
jgi:FkbM family methyltransferase